MYPIKCGFCQHGNPANSKFCNACGAPLTAEPCPRCGAVNDVMATTCEKCEAPLGDTANDFFYPLPPEMPANPESAFRPKDSEPGRHDVCDEEGLQPGPSSPSAASEAFDDALPPSALPRSLPGTAAMPRSTAESMTDGAAAERDPPSHDGQPPNAASAEGNSGRADDRPAGPPTRRMLGAALIVAVLAVPLYFAYRHFQHSQPSDAVARTASKDQATDRGSQATPTKPVDTSAAASPPATAKPIFEADASPAAPPPAAVSRTRATAADAPVRRDQVSDLFGIAPARPPASTETSATSIPDQQQPARPAQEVPKTSGTVVDNRLPSQGGGITSPQKCTDALAALGLCAQENTQGRKP